MADPPARVPQLGPDEWTEEAMGVFKVLIGAAAGQSSAAQQTQNHVLRTFTQYPQLTKPFLEFNRRVLMETSLPHRLRQIAISRTAWIRRAVYMWSSHLRVSLSIGMGREDFEALKVGASSPHWTPFEAILVGAVDDLVGGATMSDETWAALSKELDTKQIMDLLFTVGCYDLLAMVFNSLRIEREPELAALGDEYGAP
jgi:alkylhydroperoxidase family enzyme